MAPTLNIIFFLRKKKLIVVVKRSQGVSWAFSTPDKTPFYKNVLALELFVGRVFAYFQMFSLAEIPPPPPTYQKSVDDHRLLPEEKLRLGITINHTYVSEHTCFPLKTTWVESSH